MTRLPSKSSRLKVENLETRLCPAVTFDGHGTLTITGGTGADLITITDLNGEFTVEGAGPPVWHGDTSEIAKLVVDLMGGDDLFELKVSGNVHDPEAFDIDLGDGNNVARLDMGDAIFNTGFPNGNWTIVLKGGAWYRSKSRTVCPSTAGLLVSSRTVRSITVRSAASGIGVKRQRGSRYFALTFMPFSQVRSAEVMQSCFDRIGRGLEQHPAEPPRTAATNTRGQPGSE